MRIIKNQGGFSPILSIIVILLIGVIGFVGWRVYQQPANTNVQTSTQPNAKTVAYANQEWGFRFAYSKEWKTEEGTQDPSQKSVRIEYADLEPGDTKGSKAYYQIIFPGIDSFRGNFTKKDYHPSTPTHGVEPKFINCIPPGEAIEKSVDVYSADGTCVKILGEKSVTSSTGKVAILFAQKALKNNSKINVLNFEYVVETAVNDFNENSLTAAFKNNIYFDHIVDLMKSIQEI